MSISISEMSEICEVYLKSLSGKEYDELSVLEEAELSKRVLANPNDLEAIDSLVRSRIRFAFKRIRRLFPYNKFKISPEDLISCANMAITEAAQRFDYRKGTKFTTYIEFWLRNEGYKHLHGSHIVKVPVRVASSPDLFAKLNLSAVSIDQPSNSDGGHYDETSYNILDASGMYDDPDTSIDDELLIQELFKPLSSKEIYVIVRRYLYDQTLRDVAEELGGTITHQGINVIEKRAIAKMKKKYRSIKGRSD